MRAKTSSLALVQADASSDHGSAVRVGWLSGRDRRGQVLVDFEGNAAGPLPARSTVKVDARLLADAVRERRPAVLIFEGSDPSRPLLLGLIQQLSETPPARVRNVGEPLVLESDEAVVLKCGPATITLTRDGQVTIRGSRIVSTAKGTHRIRGGAVQIN
jgi:hypothetical protein